MSLNLSEFIPEEVKELEPLENLPQSQDSHAHDYLGAWLHHQASDCLRRPPWRDHVDVLEKHGERDLPMLLSRGVHKPEPSTEATYSIDRPSITYEYSREAHVRPSAVTSSRLYDQLSVLRPLFTDPIDRPLTGEVAWANPLDAEEREEMVQELSTALVRTMVSDDWAEYDRALKRWRRKAALAHQYATPLTQEQQEEHDAWLAIQDAALDAAFAGDAEC